MSHLHRFFVPPDRLCCGIVELPDEEAHHAAQALRLRAGDAVEVFDGEGRLGQATVQTIKKRAASVEVESIEDHPRPAACLHLCCAIPKGKRWQVLVEKCTELGAWAIHPVLFRWSVAEGAGDRSRWQRWAIEAAKQCRRLWLPRFHAPVTFDECLHTPPADHRFLAAPGGGAWETLPASPGSACMLIGPEAGLAEEETTAAQEAGFVPLSLGPHILRIETAAMAACAVFAARYGTHEEH